MCKRKSTALRTIEAMCSSQQMDIAELTAKSKLLLESYRSICWSSLGICRIDNQDGYCICDDSIEQALEYLNTYSADVNKNLFQQKLRMLFDSRWMVEIVDSTMIQVKEFPLYGERYFEILFKYYLSRGTYSETDLCEILKLERSCYYDRKKEAILVFGLALWGTVLPKLETMLQEETLDDAS